MLGPPLCSETPLYSLFLIMGNAGFISSTGACGFAENEGFKHFRLLISDAGRGRTGGPGRGRGRNREAKSIRSLLRLRFPSGSMYPKSILRPQSTFLGPTLKPEYLPFKYMDPWGFRIWKNYVIIPWLPSSRYAMIVPPTLFYV